jgi:hypothetical protein
MPNLWDVVKKSSTAGIVASGCGSALYIMMLEENVFDDVFIAA